MFPDYDIFQQTQQVPSALKRLRAENLCLILSCISSCRKGGCAVEETPQALESQNPSSSHDPDLYRLWDHGQMLMKDEIC